ncbi:MAG: TatD family hydrolase [Lachnospiraceae bacterium]|nr:TatD family hydrolase [Lachnospiraceae bacterium]
MIFETHAHYDDEAFDEDRETLLAGMQEHGIGRLVNIGANMASSEASVALAEQYDYIYAAVGVHPSDIQGLKESDMDRLIRWAAHDKVVAIGEIGLDYHYEDPPKDIQQYWFRRQMEVASKVKLPIVIHSRDAAKDTVDLMKEADAGSIGGVIHCYSYTKELAREFLNMDYYIGIGGVLTFSNAKKLKEAAEYIPLDHIVLETDSPYLAPVPNRGKRNSSLNLPYVVRALADIKGLTTDEIEAATWENAMRLYRIS